jgi:hypothetical protein
VAPVATGGTAILVLASPFTIHRFVPGVEGWEAVTKDGTVGPAASADEVIAIAEQYGIKIERR